MYIEASILGRGTTDRFWCQMIPLIPTNVAMVILSPSGPWLKSFRNMQEINAQNQVRKDPVVKVSANRRGWFSYSNLFRGVPETSCKWLDRGWLIRLFMYRLEWLCNDENHKLQKWQACPYKMVWANARLCLGVGAPTTSQCCFDVVLNDTTSMPRKIVCPKNRSSNLLIFAGAVAAEDLRRDHDCSSQRSVDRFSSMIVGQAWDLCPS